MLFSQVKGQKNLIVKIKSIIDNNHFPHAVLLSGNDGYGNLAIALATAQYISCTSRTDTDSCSQCPSCHKYGKLVHPDLHFIFPTTTTKKIDKNNESSLFIKEFRQFISEHGAYCNLNQWYNFIGTENKQGIINVKDADNIISTLTMKTYESEFKVMIIWNADKMNHEASDKILKILEEPYPNTFFILTTEHKDRIIPTILSRVQQITVPPLDNQTMYKEIKNYNPSLTDEQISSLVVLCEGNYNRIGEYYSDEEMQMRNDFIEMNRLAMMYRKNAKEIWDFTDTLSKSSREEIKKFLSYFLSKIEKCYLFNNVPSSIHPLVGMDDKFKNNYPRFITSSNVEGICKIIDQVQKSIDRNANLKITVFDMIIKLGKQLEKR
ncbi:MAG: hypothetical protein J6P44_06105 [Bacteroidales bacterium]|nr:hypothetical protein [Bacteroidales bacterium]